MGLIKNLVEYLSLKREEKAVVRELAQERLNKKREKQAKLKEFNKMLDKQYPCNHIIRLEHYWTKQVDYFLMDMMPLSAISLLQRNIKSIPCTFKQLTGCDAGQIYSGRFNPESQDEIHMYLHPMDSNKLTIRILGYRNTDIQQRCGKLTELEKQYGQVMSIKQLLRLWKADNGKEKIVDINEDYEMVNKLYNSEDILNKDTVFALITKTQMLSHK